jgi:ribosome-binding protein aMBF1 (putative translation factor)
MTNHPHRSLVKDWPSYLKRFRDRHGLTQQELADKLPTSVRRIEAFEQGESVPPQYLKRALRDLERQLETSTPTEGQLCPTKL